MGICRKQSLFWPRSTLQDSQQPPHGTDSPSQQTGLSTSGGPDNISMLSQHTVLSCALLSTTHAQLGYSLKFSSSCSEWAETKPKVETAKRQRIREGQGFFAGLTNFLFYFIYFSFLLTFLEWQWITRLYRFQTHFSTTHHLYPVLYVHHPKSSVSPFIPL